ncbi:pyridoxal-phosphate dependent enzyme, partial [Ciceribacter ferrooxidans]
MSQKSDLIVGQEAIEAAARRLVGVAVRTPLMQYPDPRACRAGRAGRASRAKQSRLLVKPESLQPTGSFKIRGAYAAITALTPEQRGRGV